MTSAPVELGEVCIFLSGFAFKSDLFTNEPTGLPLIRIRDVLPGTSNTYYSGPYQPQYVAEKGDILIGMDGEFNRERWQSEPALLNQRVCKAITRSEVLDDGYLYHVLPMVLKKIEDETPFVTVKHLSVAKLKCAQIALPPLEEQRRIAAILD
jgi:type I restriction enzyme S subunit